MLQISSVCVLSVDEESEPPPGIDNWFSSYAYQSPPLDTMDDLLSDHTVDSNEEVTKKVNIHTASKYSKRYLYFDCGLVLESGLGCI